MELFFDSAFAGTGNLNELESKHCINVLRHKEGDIIYVTNGKGQIFECSITTAHPKRCQLKVISIQQAKPRPYYLHVAIAPTKNNDRLEWFIEKAVEMGIDEITPILCHHSERRNLRIDRLEKIVISASKQSLKSTFTKVNELTKFNDFIKANSNNNLFIAHCREGEKPLIKHIYQQNTNAIIMIGPEGDFSEKEVLDALNLNAKAISLGDARLRTETAGVVAVHSIHFVNM